MAADDRKTKIYFVELMTVRELKTFLSLSLSRFLDLSHGTVTKWTIPFRQTLGHRIAVACADTGKLLDIERKVEREGHAPAETGGRGRKMKAVNCLV